MKIAVSNVIFVVALLRIEMHCDSLKSLAPHFYPIRGNSRTNFDWLALVFPRLPPAAYDVFVLRRDWLI